MKDINFILNSKKVTAKKGETIIVVAGLPIGFKGNTNLIRVIKL